MAIMLKSKLKSAVAALVFVAAPFSAHAEDVLLNRTDTNWHLYHDTDERTCWSAKTFDKGTTVTLHDAPGRSIAISVSNPSWTNLRVGAKYRVEMFIDGKSPWWGDMTAKSIDTGNGRTTAFILELNGDFAIEFARGSKMELYFAGQRYTTLYLGGTMEALNLLAQCLKSVSSSPAAPSAPSRPNVPMVRM
jgi:hypothetical protein